MESSSAFPRTQQNKNGWLALKYSASKSCMANMANVRYIGGLKFRATESFGGLCPFQNVITMNYCSLKAKFQLKAFTFSADIIK